MNPLEARDKLELLGWKDHLLANRKDSLLHLSIAFRLSEGVLALAVLGACREEHSLRPVLHSLKPFELLELLPILVVPGGAGRSAHLGAPVPLVGAAHVVHRNWWRRSRRPAGIDLHGLHVAGAVEPGAAAQ